jgi:predicted heme/steroid binding protein
MKEFTLEELAEFDGREGRAAYVAYEGVVYDITTA